MYIYHSYLLSLASQMAGPTAELIFFNIFLRVFKFHGQRPDTYCHYKDLPAENIRFVEYYARILPLNAGDNLI